MIVYLDIFWNSPGRHLVSQKNELARWRESDSPTARDFVLWPFLGRDKEKESPLGTSAAILGSSQISYEIGGQSKVNWL
jgi:hypothetical protein